MMKRSHGKSHDGMDKFSLKTTPVEGIFFRLAA